MKAGSSSSEQSLAAMFVEMKLKILLKAVCDSGSFACSEVRFHYSSFGRYSMSQEDETTSLRAGAGLWSRGPVVQLHRKCLR